MSNAPVVSPRARWAELIESIHSSAADDPSWGAPILASLRSILPGADDVTIYVLEHSADASHLEPRYVTETARTMLGAMSSIDAAARERAFLDYHYTKPVLTHLEATRLVEPAFGEPMGELQRSFGIRDSIGLVAHPAPGVVATIAALYGRPITLSRHERELLTRLVLHLETGYRARNYPQCVRAEIDERGRLIRHDERPLSERLVASHAERIDLARERGVRESAEALELWPALAAGELTMAPRPNGGYLVLENPPGARALRALDAKEAELLSLLARGMSNKLAAYALGVSSAAISDRLASIAAKIGVATRIELLRIAALLGNDPRSELPSERLTAAERDVLALVERGLSNERISQLRGRSARTVANQVAALLRKTGEPSRRSLVVRAARSTDGHPRR